MSRYTARFSTTISLAVTLDAEDEEQAGDQAWTLAEEYLSTVYGNRSLGVVADATLDGIGADEVDEVAR